MRIAPVSEAGMYVNAWPRAHVLLLLEVPASAADEQWQQRLSTHFGLTATESRVLDLLKAGHNVERIAVLQDVNPSTVRTHLRALFLKTGRNRQSGLVRLALGY